MPVELWNMGFNNNQTMWEIHWTTELDLNIRKKSMRTSTQPEIFDRYPWCKLLSEAHGDLFPEVSAVNRTMSPLGSISGKCLEFLFMSFRHFPSLVHSSAASCRKSRQREAFPPVLQNPSLAGFSLRGKPATLQRSTKVRGGHCGSREKRALPRSGMFYGHVLTVSK